jgi:hypothetical protein
MGKINKSDFSTKRPKLEWEDLEEEVAVLVCMEAEQLDIDGRPSIVLSFEGTDKVLWPSPGDIGTLIDKLGDDTDEWIGQSVPVAKVTRKFKGESFKKVAIVEAEEWADYVKPKRTIKTVKGGKKR